MSEQKTESGQLRCAEPDCDHDWCDDPGSSWFRDEYERAKSRNALVPPHARMIVTNPALSAHVRNPPGEESP